MAVWILHQKMTREEEDAVLRRTHLQLPISGLPDLSGVHGIQECKKLLQLLHAGKPPEFLHNEAERVVKLLSVQPEDAIAVPLHAKNKMAIAQVSGPYHYEVGKDGEDIHAVPVTWQPKLYPLARFKKHTGLFMGAGKHSMAEVTGKEERIAVHGRLPGGYNRFAGISWILGIIIAMRIASYVIKQLEKAGL